MNQIKRTLKCNIFGGHWKDIHIGIPGNLKYEAHLFHTNMFSVKPLL